MWQGLFNIKVETVLEIVWFTCERITLLRDKGVEIFSFEILPIMSFCILKNALRY